MINIKIINDFIEFTKNYLNEKMFFDNSNNKQAIITEILSNLTIYLRSNNFYEDLITFNIIENNNIEDFFENILYDKDTETLETIIELSFLNNLTVNKIINKTNIDVIDNNSVNHLSSADGIQFVNDNEIIISYASTSYEIKKNNNKILDEVNSAIITLNNEETILYLKFLDLYKTKIYNSLNNKDFNSRLIEITNYQKNLLKEIKKLKNKNIDLTTSVVLKKIVKNILGKKSIKDEEVYIFIENIKKEIKSYKKYVKISISDTLFNSKEMFKIFLEIRDKIKNGQIDNFILENIKTNNVIVFNKKKMEYFNEIYKGKFDDVKNSFIERDHNYFQKESFIENLINSLYIEHFNINAEIKLPENIQFFSKQELEQFFIKEYKLKDIIIQKGINEDFQKLTNNFYSKLFSHLKIIKVFYDAKEIFDTNSLISESNHKFLSELDKFIKLDKKFNELELMLSLKFFKTILTYNKTELDNHIINMVAIYINAKLNRYYSTSENHDKIKKLVNFILDEEIYFNRENKVFEISENLNKTEYSTNKDIVEEMSDGYRLSGLNLDETFFIQQETTEKISELYFKEFIENNINLNPKEKQLLIEQFVKKTFGGKENIAIEHAIADTMIDTNFTQLKTEAKKRLETFFNMTTINDKQVIIVVDYDNDGTISKIIAEKIKNNIQEQLGNSYKNGNNIHIVFTKNANETRGLTYEDIKDTFQKFDNDSEVMLITADNGTSNIIEIDKILNIKQVINNSNKNINISLNNILITDHHPMENENKVSQFYINNNNKVLLFNPEYKYVFDKNKSEYKIEKSQLKNVSGATTFYNSISFLIPEKRKPYFLKLTAIADQIDYVDIEHAQISDNNEINENQLMAKKANLLQKFSIYFHNILLSLNKNSFKNINTLRKELSNLDEPINNLALIFINNLMNDNIYFKELFNPAITDKTIIINKLFEELKNLQSDYIKSVVKDEDYKENITTNVIKLMKILNDNSFEHFLRNFKTKIMLLNSQGKTTKNINIKEIVLNNNGKKVVLYIDNSIPSIPRKILMDVMRYKTKEHEGIMIYANDNGKTISGSARTTGSYLLRNFYFENDNNKIIPTVKGHLKAAGFEIKKEDLSKLINDNYKINYDNDNEYIVQNIIFSNIKDFETTLNSITKITNKKTGGLDFQFLISIDDIATVGIGIEKFFSPQFQHLNKTDNNKNIKYSDVIKNHRNYSILLNFKTSLKLNISGYMLKNIIKKINNNEKFYLNFKFFNNTFMLENLITDINKPNMSNFHYKTTYQTETKDVIEYKQTINELKKGNKIENEFAKARLIEKVLCYDIDIKAIKNSKKQILNNVPLLSGFNEVLKSFGLYEKNDIKNLKNYLIKIEEYYNLLYQNSKKLNFIITDTETNGLSAHLTQVGFVVLKGEIIDGKWKLKDFKNLTTLVKYDDNFGLSPAIENLTKIDGQLLIDYGTDFKKIGKIFLDELPEAKNSMFIAHNAGFDFGILVKNSDKNFRNYMNNITIFDTARLSRELNSAGSYQLMTKLSVFNEDTSELQYIGIVPESINSVNAKILNKNKIEGAILEFKTITGQEILWIGNKITITEINGSKMTYFGNLVSKEGHDIKLYSVEQNIYNKFLNEAKQLIKNDKNNLDNILLKKIISYFNISVFNENWDKIDPSKKINKKQVLDIIKRKYILPYYKNSLLLTKKQRMNIFNKITYDINLYKMLVRILDNKITADTFFNIYYNDELSSKEKIFLYKQEIYPLIKDFKNEYKFLEILENINNINDINDNIEMKFNMMLKSSVFKGSTLYPLLETFFKRPEPAKKMMIQIFDENKKLNLLYNNTRQEKDFFKVFTNYLNDLENLNTVKDIRNFIKSKKDLNNISLNIKDKIILFQKFIILSKEPYFELTVKELHNNFNASGDVVIEALILTNFYIERLNEFDKNKIDEIIKEVYFGSNLTNLSAQVREIKFNTATNQLMYFFNIQDNNFIIDKQGITLKLKINKYEVDKFISIEDIEKEFPNNHNIILKYISEYNLTKNNKEKEIIKNNLQTLFLFNDDVDLSLNYQINNITDNIMTISHINKVIADITTLLKELNKKTNKLTNDNSTTLFQIFKDLYKEIVTQDLKGTDNKLIFNNIIINNLKDYDNISKIEVSDNQEKCFISFINDNKKITKNFDIKFILKYSKLLANLNTLISKNIESEEIDLYKFETPEDYKSQLENILQQYYIVKLNIEKNLDNTTIYKNNIKQLLERIIKITLLNNENSNNSQLTDNQKLKIVENAAKAINIYKDLDKNSNYIDNLIDNYLSDDTQDNIYIKLLKEKLNKPTEIEKLNIGKTISKPSEFILSNLGD